MRSYRKLLSAAAALLLVLSLLMPTAFAQSAQPAPIRILFTHDMHSSLVPATVASQDGELVESGGFARLTTAIKQEKAQNPEGTLLVDAGDYSMGTLFQTLELTVSPELRLMGMMGYDAVTAGNHEFDYTSAGFARSLKAAAQGGGPLPAYVMSNTTLPEEDSAAEVIRQAMNEYGVKEYTVVEKNGVRIGIFGLMGEQADANAPMAVPAVFEDIKEASKRVVKILKEQEGVDLIVCLSHSGTWENKSESEDELLAKAVPDIDVIISGHTHTILHEPIIVGNTVIASCGADSAYLGVLDIEYDGGWSVQGYRLRKIDPTISDDPAIAAQIGEYRAMIDEYLLNYGMGYDQVIATSPYQFEDIYYMFDNPDNYMLGDITSDAFVHAVKQTEGENYETIDVAVVPMGTIRATINKGDITVADAFKILSLGTGPDGLAGYPLISVYLKGWELKNVCEVDASISSMLGDAQLFMSGIEYTYNPNRLIFNKVTNAALVREDGSREEIDPEKTYRVVCGIYSGQMLSYVKSKSFGIVSLTPKDRGGNEITDFYAQIIYADKNGQKREIKEWEAVAGYLMSYPAKDGISVIPQAYSAAQNRKIEFDSANIFDLLDNLNTFALIVIGVVIVLLAVIALVISAIVRRARRKRRVAIRA